VNPRALIVAALLAAACSASRPFVSPDLAVSRQPLELDQDGRLVELANGLRALIIPVQGTNLVRVDVRYSVGGADDPADRGGMAHLVEHMSFEGRRVAGGPTLQDELTARTLALNAFTTRDETHYWSMALSRYLEPILELEARRMKTPCSELDAETFEREREVVLNERSQRGISAFERALYRSWYGKGHPYDRSLAGSVRDLKAATLDDVCQFLDDHYNPQNAVIVIAGAVQIPTAELVLRQHFGGVDRPDPLPRRAIPTLDFSGSTDTQTIAIDDPLAVIAFAAPVDTDRESTFTDLLMYFLSREMGRALSDLDYVEDFGILRAGGARAPVYAAYIQTAEVDDLDKAVDEFFDRRQQLVKGVFDGFAFDRTKSGTVARLLEVTEPLEGRAMAYARMAQYSRHSGFLGQAVADRQGVSSADLAVRAEGFFARERTKTTRLLPSGDVEDADARSTIVQRDTEYDIPKWGAAVTVADASRPAELPPKLRRPAVTSFELENGLRVLMVPDLSFPLVQMRLVFDAGESDDPQSAPGTAFFAGMLLENDWNRRYLQRDIDEFERVMRMGGSVSAEVDETATVFSIGGLSRFADGLLWQLFWQVYSGEYDEDGLEAIQKRLREADGEDESATGAGGTGDRLTRALFGAAHPYSIGDGTLDTLRTIDADDLERFRQRHYSAASATLIVAGQFDPADMRHRIARLYSLLPSSATGAESRRTAEIPGALDEPGRVAVADDERAQARIAIAFATSRDDRVAARIVMVELVRQRMASLRLKLGSTYGTQVGLQSNRGPGVLSIVADVAPDRYAKTLELALSTLGELHAGEGIEADFVRARRAVLSQVLARQANSSSVADELTAAVGAELPLDFYDRIAGLIAEVTVADVRAVLRDELAPDRAAIVGEGQLSVIEAGFRAAGIEKRPTR